MTVSKAPKFVENTNGTLPQTLAPRVWGGGVGVDVA